jgi:hypothetical protein
MYICICIQFVPHRKHNTSPFCSQEPWPLDHRGGREVREPIRTWQYNVKIDPWETRWGDIDPVQDRGQRGNETCRLSKMLENCWVDERLAASQEGLNSMKLDGRPHRACARKQHQSTSSCEGLFHMPESRNLQSKEWYSNKRLLWVSAENNEGRIAGPGHWERERQRVESGG